MNKTQLSIILPFYNVESYIADCLESIYSQNVELDKFEVICIDDCSPDNSRMIVQKYQEVYTNFKLITHDDNLGLGAGRNTGIQSANGKYLWFVDSDDLIEPNALTKILKQLREYELDVLCFNYSRVNDQGQLIERLNTFENTSVYSNGIEFVKQLFGKNFVNHLGYVWRNIYRKDYLLQNELYFPVGILWEDTVFFPKAILMANKIKSIETHVYCYRDNADSISGSSNRLKHNRIYEFAFYAGWDLYQFANEFKGVDYDIANDLERKSIWYFNSFVKFISLSSFSEKLKFYKLIIKNKHHIKKIKPHLSIINRLVINPIVGVITSTLLKSLYILKNKKRL